jgi:hypothetical protein
MPNNNQSHDMEIKSIKDEIAMMKQLVQDKREQIRVADRRIETLENRITAKVQLVDKYLADQADQEESIRHKQQAQQLSNHTDAIQKEKTVTKVEDARMGEEKAFPPEQIEHARAQ